MANETQTETAGTEMFDAGSVTIAGLKTEFGIARSSAYKLMDAGKLPYSTPFGRRLIPRAAIKKLLSEEMVGASGK